MYPNQDVMEPSQGYCQRKLCYKCRKWCIHLQIFQRCLACCGQNNASLDHLISSVSSHCLSTTPAATKRNLFPFLLKIIIKVKKVKVSVASVNELLLCFSPITHDENISNCGSSYENLLVISAISVPLKIKNTPSAVSCFLTT